MSAEYLADDPASSSPLHFPVSAQLYWPESWITDDARRKRTRVPSQISQQTKPEIALALLDRARAWGVPIQAVVVDAGYGDNPNFLAGLDERQVPSVCAVESTDCGCACPTKYEQQKSNCPRIVAAGSHASRTRRHCTPSKSSSMRSPPPPGRRLSGARARKA